MVKKKVVKKTTKKSSKKVSRVKSPIKKSSSKKAVKRIASKSASRRVVVKKAPGINRKIYVTLRNLLFFAVLSLLSFVFYSVSTVEMYQQLFYILAMVFGFVSLAFLVLLLVVLFIRLLRK